MTFRAIRPSSVKTADAILKSCPKQSSSWKTSSQSLRTNLRLILEEDFSTIFETSRTTPTVLGLFFSILGQFTGMGYGTDTNGDFIRLLFPKNALIGKNVPEKIAIGTFNWLFHLVSDIDGSSQNAGKGAGIPGPVLSLLKELSSTPLFKNVKVNYEESEISFSKWISKLFNGTYFKDAGESPLASTSEQKWVWRRNYWSNPYSSS